MTESEWLVADDPIPMYLFTRSDASDRKLQLFGCACCYRWMPKIYYHETQTLLEVVERFVDGNATTEQVDSIEMASFLAHTGFRWHGNGAWTDYAIRSLWPKLELDKVMEHTAEVAAGFSLGRALDQSSQERSYRLWKRGPKLSSKENEDAQRSGIAAERKMHCDLLRCIFGNPFHPVTLDPSWLTSTALALATGIYKEKAFDRLPILADALQDADCDDEDILNHCRQPGVHCRGCFVVDQVLGKT